MLRVGVQSLAQPAASNDSGPPPPQVAQLLLSLLEAPSPPSFIHLVEEGEIVLEAALSINRSGR